MSSTPANLRVEPAREEDMPRCLQIVLNAFEHFPKFDIISGGPDSEKNRKLNAERHWRGFKEHLEKYPSVSPGIKCVYTDPDTGEDKIIGFAEWFVWDRERTEEEYMVENYILRMEWVEDMEKRQSVLDAMEPEFNTRRRAMKGRPFALLCYMSVDPEYRRRGAASACVKWGMDKCAELGIPAYLEASREGMLTYQKLGWELYDVPGMDMVFPPMVWYPPNVARE
ncbi:acyl-CoA N-acyltransferase [Trichoderma barbatum]